ncbi:MAG: hypothetical protein K2K44_04700, partial [Oscillospiraceae bacterium]|nr:hypothetical protein [Oscillospiraceae bacterium]
ETELGCSLSETFGIESDKIPNMESFVSALTNANIMHTIKNKNNGKQVVFFANRDKEKVINIFNANNKVKSMKKHRSH